MNDLSQTLSTVRRRITRYKSKSITEQDTKASLIDPVLRALGWDLEDLDEVKWEYKRGKWKRPVDYALFLMRDNARSLPANRMLVLSLISRPPVGVKPKKGDLASERDSLVRSPMGLR